MKTPKLTREENLQCNVQGVLGLVEGHYQYEGKEMPTCKETEFRLTMQGKDYPEYYSKELKREVEQHETFELQFIEKELQFLNDALDAGFNCWDYFPYPDIYEGGEFENTVFTVVDSIGWKLFENRTLRKIEFLTKRKQAITPEPIHEITSPQNRITIQWNGQKNVLADIFRQLKGINNKEGKDGEPLISNSYEEIAVFLKENFSCYIDTELSTILTTLKKGDRPNTTRRIIIEKEK